MSNKNKIEIFSADGDVKDYLLLSARIPQFREKYPIEEGYRVKIEVSDALSAKPSLMRLYESAISNGHKPSDLGLPPLPGGEAIIFRASLLDKDETVLESASAYKPILQYKDWEKGETAARQRLLAALGFGGEFFDKDEESDITDQGKTTVMPNAAPANGSASKAAVKPDAKKSTTEKAVKSAKQEDQPQGPEDTNAAAQTTPSEAAQAGEEVQATDASQIETDASGSSDASDTEQPTAASDAHVESANATPATSAPAEGVAEEIPARIVKQIEHQAKLKGISKDKIPPYATVKEAKLVLRDLMRNK